MWVMYLVNVTMSFLVSHTEFTTHKNLFSKTKFSSIAFLVQVFLFYHISMSYFISLNMNKFFTK
jgi:hypothetical protein